MVDPRMDGCKGKLVGMVGVIFLSGMAAGAITMNLVDRYWLNPPALAFDEAGKRMAFQHFQNELALDASQARAMESILDEFIMEQAELMNEIQNSRLAGQNRIIQILNEDQRKRFERVFSELQPKRQD